MTTRRLAFAVFALCTVAGAARAEPYLAVREGLPCGGCHVNRTGGGMRLPIVAHHAREILRYPHWFDALTQPADAFTGELNSYVSIGADLRAANTAVFQDQGADGTVRNNTAFRGRLEANVLDVSEAVGYLQVRLIPDTLTFYLDQRFRPTTENREAFGLLRLPRNFFLKAGRLFLPYGLALQDDTAFIRGGHRELTGTSGTPTAQTGISFNTQESGAAVGYEPGWFSAVLAVTDGAPRDRDVRVTGTISAMFSDLPVLRHVFVGGSGTRSGPPGAEITLLGVFAGAHVGPFTYLGEADFRDDRSAATGGTHQGTFLHYSEGNLLLFDWLNVKLAFDYADSAGDLAQRANDSENRVSLGVEPFLCRFVQTRVFYRVANGAKSQPTHNQDTLTAEAHLFF